MKTNTEVLFSWMLQLLTDDAGQDLVEYALVASLLGLAAVASLKGVGTRVVSSFTFMSTTLSASI